jgi:hypothetical protein
MVGRMTVMPILLSLIAVAPYPLVSASPANYGWNFSGNPVSIQLVGGYYPAFAVPLVSTLDNTSTGIVFMVVHNSLGQTAQISTATLVLLARGNGTAYPVYFGLPPGEYSATFFAVAAAGYAFSLSETASFTVGR